jgi:hypothetical protein
MDYGVHWVNKMSHLSCDLIFKKIAEKFEDELNAL